MITVLRACGAFLLTWITLFFPVLVGAWAGMYDLANVAPAWLFLVALPGLLVSVGVFAGDV